MHERRPKLLETLKTAFRRFKHSNAVTKQDLQEMEKRIMSKISDYLEELTPKVESIQAGVNNLQQLLEDFNNTPGDFSPEEKAAYDKLKAAIDALVSDANSVPPTPA